MKDLKERQNEMKEFLEDMDLSDLLVKIIVSSLESAYILGKIDGLENKYAQNNKK